MTVELFGFSQEDFVDDMEYVGAASFLPVAQTADVCLFI
jgi:peroxiredoxin family protein